MRFFSTNTKVAAFVWLVIVCLLSAAAWVKEHDIDTNIMHLLPKSQQHPLESAASKQIGKQVSQRLLVIISGKKKSALRDATSQAANAFERLDVVGSVQWQLSLDDIKSIRSTLFPYRYVLLDAKLVHALEVDDTTLIRNQAISQIINPVSVGSIDLKSDPFNLQTQWELGQRPRLNVIEDDGYLSVNNADRLSYLVLLTLEQDVFQTKTQQPVLQTIRKLQAQFKPENITIETSGLLVHADAGVRQAELELSTIGLGSLLGILIIMLWVLRSWQQTLLLLIPVTIGCLVATASVFLLFKQVHIVTFSFGASLIGISIDYALHYVCERRYKVDAIRFLLPGLCLALCSSLIAYSALAVTPFPGLRQMAAFSVLGLLGAWLTVILWMPILTRKLRLQPISCASRLMVFLQKMPSVDTHRSLIPALFILVIVAVVMMFYGKSMDDIRMLQTSPPALIAQDAKVQKQLKLNSASQFLLVSCSTLQLCLEREESLRPRLQKLVDDTLLTNFDMLSDQLPSLKAQERNEDLTDQLYSLELKTLFDKLNVSGDLYQKAKQDFERDRHNRLAIEQLPKTPFFELLKGRVVASSDGSVATVITMQIKNPNNIKQNINQILTIFPNVKWVDQVDNISSLLKNYRSQVVKWGGIAYLFIFILFALRYKASAVRIVAPPLVASIITVAIMMQWTSGVNLFHMLALVLVLGIGIDMGVFLAEARQEAQTWLAVTLSVTLSLIAFGLLALSQTPVLRHFGTTVLLGLSLVWVLSVVLRPVNREINKE